MQVKVRSLRWTLIRHGCVLMKGEIWTLGQMEGKWCEDRETATTGTRSARGHQKLPRAVVQMPPRAPEGTCSALNLRLPPPELRPEACCSRLPFVVLGYCSPGLCTGGDGCHSLGKMGIPGPVGGPLGCSKTLSPNGHCPGLRPGPATSLLAAPPPTSRSVRALPGQRSGLHLEALAGGFQSGPFSVSRDPPSGWPLGRPWQGNQGRAAASGQGGVAPFMARAPGRRQQVLQ